MKPSVSREEPTGSRFVSQPGEVTLSQCVSCKHKHGTGPTCAAFLDGIPEAILLGEHDHRESYPGDGGIRYEPKS